jgi:hypothetical protein
MQPSSRTALPILPRPVRSTVPLLRFRTWRALAVCLNAFCVKAGSNRTPGHRGCRFGVARVSRAVLRNEDPLVLEEVGIGGTSDLDQATDLLDKDDGEPALRKPSEHGLGHLLNPADPESEDREWIAQAWEWLLRISLGLPASAPDWLDRPAIARHGVSTPHTLRLFKQLNAGKPFAEQIKPYNFLNIAFVHPTERPANEERIVLVAPFERDPARWLEQDWFNRYSGRRYRITTEPSGGRVKAGVVTVTTYRDILDEFATHPEAKSIGADGAPCGRATVGLLARRAVSALSITHIGKETNRLDDIQAGLVTDPDEAVARFDDTLYERFRLHALPKLREVGVRETARRTGHSLGAVSAALSGKSRPRHSQLYRYIEVADDAGESP